MKVKPNSKLDISANIEPFFDDIPDRNIYDSTCFHKLLMIYVKASHLSTHSLSCIIIINFCLFSLHLSPRNLQSSKKFWMLLNRKADSRCNSQRPVIDERQSFPMINSCLWLLHLQSCFFGLLPLIKSFPRRKLCFMLARSIIGSWDFCKKKFVAMPHVKSFVLLSHQRQSLCSKGTFLQNNKTRTLHKARRQLFIAFFPGYLIFAANWSDAATKRRWF